MSERTTHDTSGDARRRHPRCASPFWGLLIVGAGVAALLPHDIHEWIFPGLIVLAGLRIATGSRWA